MASTQMATQNAFFSGSRFRLVRFLNSLVFKNLKRSVIRAVLRTSKGERGTGKIMEKSS